MCFNVSPFESHPTICSALSPHNTLSPKPAQQEKPPSLCIIPAPPPNLLKTIRIVCSFVHDRISYRDASPPTISCHLSMLEKHDRFFSAVKRRKKTKGTYAEQPAFHKRTAEKKKPSCKHYASPHFASLL